MTSAPAHPPRLAPGLHLLRRGDGYLQAGLTTGRTLVPETPDTTRRIQLLARAEASLDDVPEPLRALLHRPPSPLNGNVAVAGFGHSRGDAPRTRLRALLRGTGLSVGSGPVLLTVVAGVGEPRRSLTDALSRHDKPHLLVRFMEGAAVVGPLVVPGLTPCLRCLDASVADDDPAWPLLVEQYAAASSRDRPDGMTEPLDPLLVELALAWAARDVATYLGGDRPSTWSTTLRFTTRLREVEATQWEPHPACGCTWTMNR